MASRPIFSPSPSWPFVTERSFDFQWNPGFAPVQKKKNVRALHESAAASGLSPVLEVSTKADEKLGVRLSAFSLKVTTPSGGEVALENAFQSSKCFEGGGPYLDLLDVHPRDAKRDPRIRSSGPLVAFRWRGFDWPLVPRTVFYDWLYLSALAPHEEFLRERILDYAGFSDIEFNPKRSINCQAKSCALLASLITANRLGEAMQSPAAFLELMRGGETAKPARQGELF